jgi:hypothetical protein
MKKLLIILAFMVTLFTSCMSTQKCEWDRGEFQRKYQPYKQY